MNETDKHMFDAWAAIKKHEWHEFENKVRAEWRLSFGIWAAILASTGALIGAELRIQPTIFEYVALLVLIFVIVLHTIFLRWIQQRLKETRDNLSEAHSKMRQCLDPTYEQKKFTRTSWWKQPSVIVQFMITIILVCVLWIVIKSEVAG